MAQPQTLESLVAHYRRAVADPSLARAAIELEVRFRGIDYDVFETLLQAFAAGEAPWLADSGEITNTVNSIMEEEPAMRRGPRAATENRKISLIRCVSFDPSTGENEKKDHFYRKWALAHPFRAQNAQALGYIVSLSAEEHKAHPFTSDGRAFIRVKSRASFMTRADASGNAWRVDLTVVRRLSGADAQAALPVIVNQMFRAGPLAPASMLSTLGLCQKPELRDLYDYELELEYVPRQSKAADEVRPSEIGDLVGEIMRLANPDYIDEAIYQAEIFHIAKSLIKGPFLSKFEHGGGLKQLLPQAVALTKGGYKEIYPPTGYFLLDKADGFRSIASVRDGALLVVADKLLKFSAPGGDPPRAATIVDGELIYSADGPAFYAFDVIAILDENLTAAGYGARIARLGAAVEILRGFGLDAHPKPMVHLTAREPAELQAQFLAPAFQRRPYTTDGRILVAPEKPYMATCTYKWKPIQDTTIDFLARRAPSAVLERYADAPGCELHILFVGISSELFNALGLDRIPGYRDLFDTRRGGDSYFPIQFSPSDAPLAYLYQHPTAPPAAPGWVRDIDGKIIELQCAGGCAAAGSIDKRPDWRLVRIREDRAREAKNKYYGNDFRIAELTWLNYIDPFDEAELWLGADLGYFAGAKSALYGAQTAFTSFVKSQRIETCLPHTRWVVDAAIGKGQDLGRYIRAGVRNVVGIDKDKGALSELIRRKFSHAGADRGRKASQNQRKGPTTLFALCADLTAPHAETVAKVRSLVGFPAPEETNGADALVINLAIHYLAKDVVDLRNFAALCRRLVKVGGSVIITTMFGQRVHELFVAQNIQAGGAWELRQDGVLKYSIRRDYLENELTPAGEKVGVLLPFSDGRHYEEYLVNPATVVHEFAARGFSLVEMPTFDRSFNEFRMRHSGKYGELTELDFQFLRLFGEIILKRTA